MSELNVRTSFDDDLESDSDNTITPNSSSDSDDSVIVVKTLRNRNITLPNSVSNNFRGFKFDKMGDKLCVKTALHIIPEFDGNSEMLHKFITCCEIVHDPLSDAEKAKFMILIPSKLSKKAYELTIVQKYENWADLKSELKKQFQKSNSMASVQMELFRIQQNRTEDIRSYASRVEKLLTELNEICVNSETADAAKVIVKYNSKTALQTFQEGLREPIRLIIKACRFETLKEAITKALEEELNVRQPFPSAGVSNSKIEIECFKCHKKGHLSSNCLSNRFSPKQEPNNFNRTTNNRTVNHVSTITCAYCKKPGHHISQCRKREYNNNQKNNSNDSNPNSRKSENRVGLDHSAKTTPHRVHQA